MSHLITIKIPADTDAFRAYAAENGDTLQAIAEDGKAAGAIHHRFAIGDGFILVVDEWETAAGFQGFFEGNEKIAGVMEASGAQGEPEVTVAEAISTADEF
jgi:hypothetical protein